MNEMPDDLKLFLETRTKEQAEAIWNWLDSQPDAVDLMIRVVVESNDLQERV